MKKLRETIIDLREIREKRKDEFSYDKLLKLMEANGDYLSKSTLSRLFGDKWEQYTFDYENTIRPIAKVMIGIEDIEDTDDLDVKAMKSLLKYKIARIEELERLLEKKELELATEKVKHLERVEQIKADYQTKIDFRDKQISLKDDRIDFLMQEGREKDVHNRELSRQIMQCSKCAKGELA